MRSAERYGSSEAVRSRLRELGNDWRVYGTGAFGEELVCVETGGTAEPSILITAGTHTPESAGVVATLRLLEELRPTHRTVVVPMRDPFGFNDFQHCLTALAGNDVRFDSNAELLARAREVGNVVWSRDDALISLVGEHAVALMETGDDDMGFERVITLVNEVLDGDPTVKGALSGRRLYIPPYTPYTEGTGAFGRSYTGVVDNDGNLLSLSQFFGRDDAPPEVACLERLVDELRPGITFDCHEDAGWGFYMPARRHPEAGEESERIANRMLDAVQAGGHRLENFEQSEDYARWARPFWPAYRTKGSRDGLFWTDGLLRGIGYILVDYNLRFGQCMPTETGMRSPLADRVDMHVRAVSVGIAAYEEAHAR